MINDEFDKLLDMQRKMQSRIAKEQEMDNTIDVLQIINEMAPHADQIIQIEEIFLEAQMRGFPYNETENIIEKLVKDRVLFKPSPGFVQRR